MSIIRKKKSKPKLIVFFIVNKFQALDLFGPLDSFNIANDVYPNSYNIQICSYSHAPVKTETGIKVTPTTHHDSLKDIDTFIICGGSGSRAEHISKIKLEKLKTLARSSKRIASVCTGAFLLAELNLKPNLEITTHWEFTNELKKKYPEVRIKPEAIYTKDNNIWSSAGITAGIDMSLALISEDYGEQLAKLVAKKLVVYVCRTGHQTQFSEPLKTQSLALKSKNEKLRQLLIWIPNHLDENLTVDSLATRLAISPRHLNRIFRQEFSCTPAKFIERLRLDQARELLSAGEIKITEIARTVGFNSLDSFSRAFERQYSTTPRIYREQFSKITSL